MVGSASISQRQPNIHHGIEIDKKPYYSQIEQSPNFPYTENLWTIESVFTKGLRGSYFTGLVTAPCVFGATFLDIICNSRRDIGFGLHLKPLRGSSPFPASRPDPGVTQVHYSNSGRLSWFQTFIWTPLSFNHRQRAVAEWAASLNIYFLYPLQL